MTEQPKREPTQEEIERGFRESLMDVIAVAEKLAPVCRSVEEMIGVVELAVTNDAQMRLLMNSVNQKKR